MLLPNEPVEQPPRIVSEAPLGASVDQLYVYPVLAEDADGNIAGFELVEAPTGMRINAEVAGQMQPMLTGIQYRADGQLISARFGNGLTQTRGYDLQGRLVEQNLFDDGGAIIDARRYSYDPAGNITARTGTPGDQSYAYDALDRLTGQDIAADGKTWQYGYDPNHNRLRRGDSGGLNETYSYQPKTNRLTEIDKLIDTTEADQPRSKHFTYNQAGRFAEYREDGATRATYTYNALGQRTRKVRPDETRLFHYDTGIQLLGESDAAGSPIKDYIWLRGEPLAQIESTGLVVYLHTDHLLTPRMGTSDTRAIVWLWEGEAFGAAEAQGQMKVNLRFPGQYFDVESGLHYNYFRDYDTSTGRYVQSDPIGLLGGINSYAYGYSNPLSYSDPTGLMPNPICVAGVIATCAVIGGGAGFVLGGGVGGTAGSIVPGAGTAAGAISLSQLGAQGGAAVGGVAGGFLAGAVCPDDEPDCNEHFTRCLQTSLADAVGGSYGSSRCSLCRDSCVQSGGSWPSLSHTGDRCDYWNFQ